MWRWQAGWLMAGNLDTGTCESIWNMTRPSSGHGVAGCVGKPRHPSLHQGEASLLLPGESSVENRCLAEHPRPPLFHVWMQRETFSISTRDIFNIHFITNDSLPLIHLLSIYCVVRKWKNWFGEGGFCVDFHCICIWNQFSVDSS